MNVIRTAVKQCCRELEIDWYLAMFLYLSMFSVALSKTKHTVCCSYQTYCPLSDIIKHDPLLLLSTMSHADSCDLSVWLTRLCEVGRSASLGRKRERMTRKLWNFDFKMCFLWLRVNTGHCLGSKQNIQNLMLALLWPNYITSSVIHSKWMFVPFQHSEQDLFMGVPEMVSFCNCCHVSNYD